MVSKGKVKKNRIFRFFKNLKPLNIVALSIIVGTLGFANYVSATTKTAGPLEVAYDGDTIFAETNLAPGASIDKTVTVNNNGSVSHSFAIATENISGNLADDILLTAVVDGNAVWTKTVDELSKLSEESLTVLDSIDPGQTKPIVLRAELSSSANNDNQGQDLNFDITFGTQEAEPTLGGDLSIASLGRGALKQITSASPSDQPKEETTVGKSRGKSSIENTTAKPARGQDKRLLLIVPGVTIVSLMAFTSSWRRNVGLPLVAASTAYLLSNYIHGDMASRTFWIFLGVETIAAGAFKILIKDHHKYHIKRLHQKYFVREIG